MDIKSTKKAQLGQFFTTNTDVQKVMGRLLKIRRGVALEPSAGAGDLVGILERRTQVITVAVELDASIEPRCTTKVLTADFFDFADNSKVLYNAILGNPPFIAWKNVAPATKISAAKVKAGYSDKTNLYHLFIDRCISLLVPNGELVFIVPKEWLYSTSAGPLREKIAREGAITHVVDCGESKLFTDADVPALLIFRYQHGKKQSNVCFSTFEDAVAQKCNSRKLVTNGTSWMFLPDTLAAEISTWDTFGTQYAVRVGFVTGLDSAFKVNPGDIESSATIPVVTTLRRTELFVDACQYGSVESMPPKLAAHLARHKDALLCRRIRNFDESNWWQYGAVRNRVPMESKESRFFALAKTRSTKPFFSVQGAKYFSGGVLGLFKKRSATIGVRDAIRLLNSPKYRAILEAMSLTSNDKVSLQPATLERAPFPQNAAQIVEFLKG
jgi:adenine-specific DNA-methyltransferase